MRIEGISRQLQRYRGATNVGLWLKIAKIFAAHGLELTIGRTRLASLETPEQFRGALESRGLKDMSKVRAIFDGIIDLWSREPFTGTMDLRRAGQGVSPDEGMPGVIEEMAAQAGNPIGLDSLPIAIGQRIPLPEIVISTNATNAAFSLIRMVPPKSAPNEVILPETPSDIAGRIRSLEQQLQSIRRRDLTAKRTMREANVLIGIAREQWGAGNHLGAAIAYTKAGDNAHLYARQTGLLEDYFIARDYYDRAIECARNIELRQYALSSNYAGQVQVAIAVHTENVLDWKTAIAYFEQAASLGRDGDEKLITAATIVNIGHCYWEAAKLLERKVGKKETLANVAQLVEKAAAMPEGAAKLLENSQESKLYPWAIYCAGLSYNKLRRLKGDPVAAAKAVPLLYYSGRHFFREEHALVAAQCFKSAGDCLLLLGQSEKDVPLLRRSVSLMHLAARLYGRCLGEDRNVSDSYNEASKTMRLICRIAQNPDDRRSLVWFALRSIRVFKKVELTVGTVERMIKASVSVTREQELVAQLSKQPADLRLLITLGNELVELARFVHRKRLEASGLAFVQRAEMALKQVEAEAQAQAKAVDS